MQPTERFTSRVDDYVRYRPGYPPEIVERLRCVAGLTAADAVADLGAGTGIFTALLLPYAGRVYAVEPNAAMRAAAEARLGRAANFTAVAAPAEATTLPDASVDLVTAAQAFHWFDAAAVGRECRRILRPGGLVALVWNERDTAGSAFLRDYEALLRRHAPDYDRIHARQTDAAAVAAFFAPGGCDTFGAANVQHFDLPGLLGRTASSSYAPAAGTPAHTAFAADLTALFRTHARDGQVAFRYRTLLYVGALR